MTACLFVFVYVCGRCRGFPRGQGFHPEEALAGGGSDGNFTSQFTATLDGLGAVGDGAHARHEHLKLGATLERTALLALLVLAPPLSPLGQGPAKT